MGVPQIQQTLFGIETHAFGGSPTIPDFKNPVALWSVPKTKWWFEWEMVRYWFFHRWFPRISQCSMLNPRFLASAHKKRLQRCMNVFHLEGWHVASAKVLHRPRCIRSFLAGRHDPAMKIDWWIENNDRVKRKFQDPKMEVLYHIKPYFLEHILWNLGLK